jgi:hypothetical protein
MSMAATFPVYMLLLLGLQYADQVVSRIHLETPLVAGIRMNPLPLLIQGGSIPLHGYGRNL